MSDNFELTVDLCDSLHFYGKIKYPGDKDFKEQGCPFCLREGLESARLELLNTPTQIERKTDG